MQKMTLKHNTRTLRFIQEHHDNCTNCNRQFRNSDKTHLGYTSTKKLVYVGDCCSNLLTQTIIRHSFQQRQYTIPSPDTALWRFMDFTKFLSLITTKCLYFPRADKLGDPFEGAKVSAKNKAKWDKHYFNFFVEAIKTAPNGGSQTKNEKEILQEAKRLLKDIQGIGKRQIKETFISCWYEGQYESDAMWRIYSSSIEQAVAIKTTYKKLYNSLGRNQSIQIGRVNYIDFSKQSVGINDSFWYKRKSFEHEKEVRAIIFDHNASEETGKLVPIKVETLIEDVYISPAAQSWFSNLVMDIMMKYELKKKARPSKMSELLLLS
jgi:hypothetical protein